MRQFRWLSVGPIRPGSDLRRLGWKLCEESRAGEEAALCPVLIEPENLVFTEWLELAGATPARRKWFMAVGVGDPAERARMLRLGFGDALPERFGLEELEQRALRLIENAQSLARFRNLGSLRLDLLAREAFVAGRAAGLHPREFALLWRLVDTPGQPIGPEELLSDIWRLTFRPETNSLAVHVSRLRAKLRLAGLDGLIETMPGGAYRLSEAEPPALPLPMTENFRLDDYLRLGEETADDQDWARQDDLHAT